MRKNLLVIALLALARAGDPELDAVVGRGGRDRSGLCVDGSARP